MQQLIQSFDVCALPDAANLWDTLHEFTQAAEKLVLSARP